MKKITLSVIVLIGCLSFFALQQAHAGRGGNRYPGPDCPYWNNGYGQAQNNVTQKEIDAFLEATTELRKGLSMKHAEYQALMNSTNPDPAKAASITGEIFQLQDQIRMKAKNAGLKTGCGFNGYGCGGGWGNGYGPGRGRGYCRGFLN
jgi:hypothetical protein